MHIEVLVSYYFLGQYWVEPLSAAITTCRMDQFCISDIFAHLSWQNCWNWLDKVDGPSCNSCHKLRSVLFSFSFCHSWAVSRSLQVQNVLTTWCHHHHASLAVFRLKMQCCRFPHTQRLGHLQGLLKQVQDWASRSGHALAIRVCATPAPASL